MSSDGIEEFGVNVADISTQLATLGVVGFEKDGFKAGVTGEAAIDATKEVTGAAAAEEANEMARQQIEERKAQLEKERQDAITAQGNRARAASNASPAARRSGTSNISFNPSSFSDLGSDERDFLGL